MKKYLLAVSMVLTIGSLYAADQAAEPATKLNIHDQYDHKALSRYCAALECHREYLKNPRALCLDIQKRTQYNECQVFIDAQDDLLGRMPNFLLKSQQLEEYKKKCKELRCQYETLDNSYRGLDKLLRKTEHGVSLCSRRDAIGTEHNKWRELHHNNKPEYKMEGSRLVRIACELGLSSTEAFDFLTFDEREYQILAASCKGLVELNGGPVEIIHIDLPEIVDLKMKKLWALVRAKYARQVAKALQTKHDGDSAAGAA